MLTTDEQAFMNAIVAAPDDERLLERTAYEIKDLCASFPAPGLLL